MLSLVGEEDDDDEEEKEDEVGQVTSNTRKEGGELYEFEQCCLIGNSLIK